VATAKSDFSNFMVQAVTAYPSATAKIKRDGGSVKDIPTYASTSSGAFVILVPVLVGELLREHPRYYLTNKLEHSQLPTLSLLKLLSDYQPYILNDLIYLPHRPFPSPRLLPAI
jgi:hypothetical protein